MCCVGLCWFVFCWFVLFCVGLCCFDLCCVVVTGVKDFRIVSFLSLKDLFKGINKIRTSFFHFPVMRMFIVYVNNCGHLNERNTFTKQRTFLLFFFEIITFIP